MKLHTYLKTLRLHRGYTLRDIERRSGRKISNGYVSCLENGIETEPTPKVLRILSRALDVNYMVLMMHAGYITKKDLREVRS